MSEAVLPDVQTSSAIETPTANLPAVRPELEGAWAKIEASGLGDRMKSALRRIACSESIRGAAEAEGYSSHGDVYRYARRFGIVDVRTRSLIETHRRVAKLSGEELEGRLVDDPEAVTSPQLAVIAGISTDKVLAHEKTAKDDGGSYISALEKVAAQIAESGQTLELRVSVSPNRPGADAIDVTAEHGGGGSGES